MDNLLAQSQSQASTPAGNESTKSGGLALSCPLPMCPGGCAQLLDAKDGKARKQRLSPDTPRHHAKARCLWYETGVGLNQTNYT